ncbi:fungal-specific transcription factor domain-containing protein [Xylariaceae sp. FL0662B]|nr:fungal-specific transcription factor domain-containing protein [Xylariaceae sp. FL0662B]
MTTGSSPDPVAIEPRRRRITQACDYCHRRSIRCRPSSYGTTCQNCNDFAQPCTYRRKVRRRGVASRHQRSEGGLGDSKDEGAASRHGKGALPRTQGKQSKTPSNLSSLQLSHQALQPQLVEWNAPYIASQATIVDHVELYFEIVYPIFPFFHQPSFVRSISRAEYLGEQSLFAATMAVCALISSRIRDGAVTNPRWNIAALQAESDPDVFYAEAKRQLVSMVADQPLRSDLNVLRAHAILAIAAIQNGNIRDMHQHLGIYHTLMAMDGLHDESNWPHDISVIEREERRRLFWSIYTLDVYSAVVWGGVIRSREQQSNVAYPMEADDESITDNVIGPSSSLSPEQHNSRSEPVCWLSAWNFITDLYRVLEHTLVRFRDRRRYRLSTLQQDTSLLHDIFGDQSTATQASVRDKVLQMYINLPACFKETPCMTYDIHRDRFGFQAANITGSLQLVRMVLFAEGGASIEERCHIASEVVSAFSSIPASYLLAISTPQLHHLGGIGAILGSVFEEPLGEADYNNLRGIMLSMAQLLESLEANHRGASASEKLRSHTARIDEYMARQRQTVVPVEQDVGDSNGAVMTSHERSVQGQQPGLLHGDGEQDAENTAFQEVDPVMVGDWPLQISPNFLGEFSWNFDFG